MEVLVAVATAICLILPVATFSALRKSQPTKSFREQRRG